MADPTTTSRTTPAGIALENGHPIKVAFSADPDISLWEIATTPPEVDGGEGIPITTAWNTDWRTFAPQALKTLSPFTVRVAYDPDAYNQVAAIINVKGMVTISFPDGSTLDFFGYAQKFSPQETQEGNRPEANLTIQPTNWDNVNNVESQPVMTEVAGT